jgi:hypothetical protein
MAYAIAGIDVHKRMLAVVVSDLAAAREDAVERLSRIRTPRRRGGHCDASLRSAH